MLIYLDWSNIHYSTVVNGNFALDSIKLKCIVTAKFPFLVTNQIHNAGSHSAMAYAICNCCRLN